MINRPMDIAAKNIVTLALRFIAAYLPPKNAGGFPSNSPQRP
jgi:hypothetical protein